MFCTIRITLIECGLYAVQEKWVDIREEEKERERDRETERPGGSRGTILEELKELKEWRMRMIILGRDRQLRNQPFAYRHSVNHRLAYRGPSTGWPPGMMLEGSS
jgi:hypothetical protein